MEGTGPGFEFQPGHNCGDSILGGGDDSTSFCNTSITEPWDQPQGALDSLPTHLHDLVSQTSQDLDTNQQHRLADILLQYTDLFPAPETQMQ